MRQLVAIVAIAISFPLALPAFVVAQHNENYDVACGVLWPAVKDALANSGKFTARKFDDHNMVAEYSIGAGSKTHDGTVTLTGTGKSCELQLESTFTALYMSNDADKVSQQVGRSLKKVKSGAAMAPAVAAVVTPPAAVPASKAADQAASTPETRSAGGKHRGAELTVSSTPDGAEIEIDREVEGNTPISVQLSHGEHWVTVRKEGYRLWRRKIKIEGSPLELKAELLPEEKKVHWF